MKRIYFSIILFLAFTVFLIGCVSNDLPCEKKVQPRKLMNHDDFAVGIDAVAHGTYKSEFEYMTFSWNDNKIYKDIRIVESDGKSIVIYHDADRGDDFFVLLENDAYLSFVKEFRSILELHTVSEYLPGETSGYNSGIESFLIRFAGNGVQDGAVVEANLAMLKTDDYRYRLRQLFENLSSRIQTGAIQ